MINHKHYTYRVVWSVEDEEYIASCAEFPSLSYLAEKPAEALECLIESSKVNSVINEMMTTALT